MFRLFDTFFLAFERLWQHRVLVIWVLVGLTVASTLALSLALYVDAVNTGLLATRLTDPTYAFRYRYLGSWSGAIGRADVTTATAAITGGFVDTLGLPVSHVVRYTSSGAWMMTLVGSGALGAFTLSTLEGAEDQIAIIAGAWPPEDSAANDGAIPALIPETMLYSMGLQVGDTLTAAKAGLGTLTLRVAALWRPINPNDPAWIFTPRFFDQVMLLRPDDLWASLEGVERPIDEMAWYLIFDGSMLRTSEVDGLLARIADGERTVSAALPGIRLDLSPVDGLTAFSRDVSQLTQQLVIIVLPVGGLALYFVALVAGLLVGRQQAEDVTLRSRGMSRPALLAVHVTMWLLLAGTALGIGLAVSPAVVRLVGQTISFLRFADAGAVLEVVFTPQAVAAGALTGLIAAGSGLVLSWRSSAQTITSFRQTSARGGKAWWQRAYLDLALLVPACYVLYTLQQRGGLAASAENPFSDPLSFVGPTLFSLGLTLLFLRLWPFVLRAGAAVVAWGRGVALLMALRELTRSTGRYRGTLLMMCFTLSLAGFTASMASTIDRSLEDAVNYRIGADVVAITAAEEQTEQSGTNASGQVSYTVTGYNTLPATDLLTVEGVRDVSRAGRYTAQISLAGQRLQGTILGVDRAAIAAVTHFRADYADEPVADLFNRLAGNRTGALISAKTAQDYNLRVNQVLRVQVLALNQWYDMDVPILGVLDYFPTLNPNEGFFLVMSIDPIFEAVGTELPHNLWIGLEPGADLAAVERDAAELGYPVVRWLDPASALREAQAAPLRRGVLGFLSVGFVASVALTLVGAVVQGAASFRAQATQLGALRAMGLGGRPVGTYLILVQGLVAGNGILAGTGIGLATTLLFLPLLDFSGGLPPYLVRVAWNDIAAVYIMFAVVMFVVTLSMTLFVGRESLAALVRLGDM